MNITLIAMEFFAKCFHELENLNIGWGIPNLTEKLGHYDILALVTISP